MSESQWVVECFTLDTWWPQRMDPGGVPREPTIYPTQAAAQGAIDALAARHGADWVTGLRVAPWPRASETSV